MRDGRVAYTKWEYVDKHLGNNQSMWVVNPDGSSSQHIAGEHWGPITFWEPRAIPGSSKLITTLAPHMPIAVGPIALVDPADACSSPAKFENITAEIPPPRHFGWHRPRLGYYCNPYPLAEDFYIVSYAYGPEDRDPKGYGLYLLDRWNNRDLIYRDPEISCFEALPVQPRPQPPVIPDSGTGTGDTGTFCVLDVYQGLPGIERGSVKYLRVVQEIPKSVSAQCGGPWLQYPLVSYAGHLALKCLLGEVPVAPDGSVSFRAPANHGLYFSALDENHQEIQRMRAMTEIRPGETRSCVGCHDPRTAAPPVRRAEALQAPVLPITPPPGGPKAPDFYRDVQPILTRNCGSCHGGAKPAGGLDLSPALTNRFNVAYENLMTRGLVSYVIANNSDTLPLRPPKYYGSHASRLMQVLTATHPHRVTLSPEDRRELVTWIDLNAPYYGTYRYSRPGTEGGRELLTPTVRSGLHAVFQQSCAKCHGPETARVERVDFEGVARSPALLAPLPTSAGGTGACGTVFAGRDDPGARALIAALAVLQEELRTNPREDVQATRPPLADDNPRYVYRP
jgi:mono/diheme cytochrome c family protein